MKTLVDEILAVLASSPMPAKEIARRLGADGGDVRAAIVALADAGRAKAFTAGRGAALHLAPPDFAGAICEYCRALFERDAASRRRTCSRSCQVALGWRNLSPARLAARRAALSAAQSTPEALARTAEHNARRWSKESERRALSEQNRREWRDPYKKAKRSVAIARVQRQPEMRARYSAVKKELWKDPAYREKMLEAVKGSKRTAAYRAAFSEKMRERWRDPAMRAKYTAHNARNNEKKRAKAAEKREALRASAETAELVRRYRAGASLAECGASLGLSVGAVVFRLKLAGVARRDAAAKLRGRGKKRDAP